MFNGAAPSLDGGSTVFLVNPFLEVALVDVASSLLVEAGDVEAQLDSLQCTADVLAYDNWKTKFVFSPPIDY